MIYRTALISVTLAVGLSRADARADRPQIATRNRIVTPPLPLEPPAPTVQTTTTAGPSSPGGAVLSAAMMGQADLAFSPSSLGAAASYTQPWSYLGPGWSWSLGALLGLRGGRSLVEPRLMLEREMLEWGRAVFTVGFGAAAPLQWMSGTRALALAGRGTASVQWRRDGLMPFVETATVLGLMLTPSNVRSDQYMAQQLLMGVSMPM